MSNKHVNHQHGLHTMNETRPKSKNSKKLNKSKAKARKAPLLAALQEARYGKKETAKKVTKPSKKTTAAKKATAKAKVATKKAAGKKKAA
jgi:hypothetical protein